MKSALVDLGQIFGQAATFGNDTALNGLLSTDSSGFSPVLTIGSLSTKYHRVYNKPTTPSISGNLGPTSDFELEKFIMS
ncbi:hypothetical protein BDR07DRAFT_1462606, partial [Suillus spraguei]